MENQISRILNSDLGNHVLSSLEDNEEQIGKLQQMLSEKNNQVNQLHHLINTELFATMQQNQKLRDHNKYLSHQFSVMKCQLNQIKKIVKDSQQKNAYFLQSMAFNFENQMQSAFAKYKATLKNQEDSSVKNATDGQKNQQSKNSNSHLFQRLQKMQKLVLSLKQQKWQLEKQVKKYQSMYKSTTSPEKDYSSNQAYSQSDKRFFVSKCFLNCFSQLQQKKYCGEIIGNCKNGKGICDYSDNFTYEGSFLSGQRNGLGQMRFDGQLIYKGYWKNGKPMGKGCLYCFPSENIQSFNGFFKNGKIEGYGTILFSNGQKIRGYFNEQKILGAAVIEDYENNRLQYSQINQKIELQYAIQTH